MRRNDRLTICSSTVATRTNEVSQRTSTEDRPVLLRRTPLLIAAALLLAAPGALAQEEEFEADREAGYLGLLLSGNFETIAGQDPAQTRSSTPDTSRWVSHSNES